MPNWKKLITSGSSAALGNLYVTNAVTASFFTGDGSALTGLVSATSILTAVDDRDMKPNTSGVGATVKGVKPFFSSLGGMTGTANTDYQDVLVLDTYSDTSGGTANALSFDKSTQLIKHWNAAQTATSWGTPKTIAYTDGDITGNAATVTNGVYTNTTQTISGAKSFSNTYTEFGNGYGSVSNDGSWHGRVNVAGTSHARLDVKDLSDGIITSIYSHTGNGAGKMGTMSDHPLKLLVNGADKVTIDSNSNVTATTFTGALSGNASTVTNGVYTNTAQTLTGRKTFQTDSDYTIGLNDSTGENEWWLKTYANGNFALHENGVGDQFTIAAGGAATFAADINGQNISVGGVSSTLKGYFYESTADQNGSGKPSSVVGVAAATNGTNEGPSIDFNSVWGGSATYQQDNWNEGWTVGRIGAVYDSQVGNGGALVFYTHGGTTSSGGAGNAQVSEKLRIKPNGQVGIGTTSPLTGFNLDVRGGDFRVGDDGNQGFEAGYSSGGGVVFLQGYNRGTSAFVDMSINASITVKAGGNVGIGAENPSAKLHVSGASDVLLIEGSGSTVFEIQGSEGQLFSVTDDLSGDLFSVSDISGVPLFNVNASDESYFTGDLDVQGSFTGTTGTFTGDVTAFHSSDKRLKSNIKPIENATDKIQAIGGYTFDWNEDIGDITPNTGRDIGVIAQEIEEVAPELVHTRKNGYKAVEYQKLVALLIESNKELAARVEELENKIK